MISCSSIAIILITVSVLFLLFTFLAPTLTQRIQEDDFNAKVREILSEIEENRIQKEVLDAYYEDGILITIKRNEVVVYSSLRSELIIFEWYTDYVKSLPEVYNQDQLFHVQSTIHNGLLYEVQIMKHISFTVSDSYLLIQTIFPYFLLVGIVVSVILSVIYARFFTRKVKHLTDVTTQMKNKKYQIHPEEIQGDELQSLENDISGMYEQLINEIQVVKKLEEERQLFLRGVTHELKTPIMTMGVTLEGILAGVDGYRDIQVSLAECHQELQAMTNLVNEILDIAKIETVKDIGSVSIKEVVLETLTRYQLLIVDKSIRVSKALTEELQMTIPKNHARKIISNLVNNAIKYTPPNGQLTITIQKHKLCLINDMYEDANVEMNKIFNAFVTYHHDQDQFQKSHGLELYIIASILKQYNIAYSCFIEKQQFHFYIQLQD